MATTKLLLPIEQLKKSLKQSLASNEIDQELMAHYLAAHSWAERYCRRGFDGEKLETEYLSGNNTTFVNLKNYPVLSISEINIDNFRTFAAATALASTEYFLKSELGEVALVSDWVGDTDGGTYPEGEDNIRIKYYGGYIPEKTVVASAAKSATHTIADSLSTYGVPMYLFVKTSGAFSAASTGVAITGLDENGTSVTENVVPNIVEAAQSHATISYVTTKFTQITVVNSSALTGAGSISVTACSAPVDLRQALCILTNYLFKIDTQSRVGVRSRSTQGNSQSFDNGEMPLSAKMILDLYKTILF